MKESESIAVKGKPFQEVKEGKVLLGHVSQCPYKCMRDRDNNKSSLGLNITPWLRLQ